MKTKKIEESQVRSNAMYMASSPYIRNKGFEFDKAIMKKEIKAFYAKEANKIRTATHYVVETPLIKLIEKSMSRRQIRHFVNAMDNAEMPHQNFFIEWHESIGAAYGAHLFTQEETVVERNLQWKRNKDGKAHIDKNAQATGAKKVRRVMTTVRFFRTVTNGVEAVTMLDPLEVHINRNTEAGLGWAQPLLDNFFDVGNEEGDTKILGTDDYHRVSTMINVAPSPGHPDEKKVANNIHQWHPQETAASLRLFEYIRVPPSLISFKRDETLAQFFTETLVKLISIISLLNYDWKVENKEGVIVDKVRSVNTEAKKRDIYRKVTIDLPKKKEVLDFFKQKPRTRKFGTAEHVVRGHWRFYKKTGERVWIDEHHRGDKKYGTIHKDYVLTKRENYLR